MELRVRSQVPVNHRSDGLAHISMRPPRDSKAFRWRSSFYVGVAVQKAPQTAVSGDAGVNELGHPSRRFGALTLARRVHLSGAKSIGPVRGRRATCLLNPQVAS